MLLSFAFLLGLQAPTDPWAVIARADSAHVHDSVAAVVADWQARIDGQADDIWSQARRHKISNTVFSPASDRAEIR